MQSRGVSLRRDCNACDHADSAEATIAVHELGAISVPNVRTVDVLPALLGPRKPDTSP